MQNARYSVNHYNIQTILTWVDSGEIAIPEIQRPFVWDSVKVRDFIDSLFRGYPVGYLIVWKSPNIRLKDGSKSEGKKILIDGQQRVTALNAALKGKKIIDKDYKQKKISIAFNPKDKKFEVLDAAIQKDKTWIPDISVIFQPQFSLLDFIEDFSQKNPNEKKDDVFKAVEQLKNIVFNNIGLIELDSSLDIDTVTEIFIRINSQGVQLNQADFAMSKIAVNEKYGGVTLRKAIDYFCHLSEEPSFYHQLKEVDKEFTQTEYFYNISWLKNERDDLLYIPSYTDLLRVSFTYKFERGRLQDLVALLSGRNFETKEYEEKIVEDTFQKLSEGVKTFMNENNFKKFILIIRSAGFISSSLIRSKNAINFSYILYLKLREQSMNQAEIESYVRKWFVFSVLTSRYSGSPESTFDYDIKQISNRGVDYINDIFAAELSDTYWSIGLPQQMNTSVTNSPVFHVFLASQIKNNDKAFLSKDITVKDLITVDKGDVHHIFPREYLKKFGHNRGIYNQIANFTLTQSEINIAIGAKPPREYLSGVLEQCQGGKLKYGRIDSIEELYDNFAMNCIPKELIEMDASHYNDFLNMRRKLMAQKIKEYFLKL